MRDQFYKFLPWVLGGVIGFFLFRPPAFLQDLGMFAWVIQGVLLVAALLSFVALMLVGNLPENVEMTPVSDSEMPPDLVPLVAKIEGLGMQRVGAPWKVKVAPAAILVGFSHPTEPIFASAFCTGTVPAKTSFDFVSVFDGYEAGLTTNNNPEGAVLPEGNSSLRQVFPGENPKQLLQRHKDALGWMHEMGLRFRNVSPDRFEEEFKGAMRAQRRLFLASPLRGTFVTLWRAATKQIPFKGPLSEQEIAVKQLHGLVRPGPIKA